MGCVFCATGLDGVIRNLTTGEIIEQMLQLQRLLTADERLSNIVVMGMGEPLLNIDAMMPALAAATDADGLGIGVRRVTISTVGLPKGIRRLAEMDCPYHLAVSLHAPNDEIRNRLVPANRSIGMEAILAAADEYFDRTGRRVTFEYVLLAGINDQPEHARGLVNFLRGRPALVNLIPYNPVPGLPYHTPDAGCYGGVYGNSLSRGSEREYPLSQRRADPGSLRAIAAGENVVVFGRAHETHRFYWLWCVSRTLQIEVRVCLYSKLMGSFGVL